MNGLVIQAVTENNLELVLPLVIDYQRFYKVRSPDMQHNRQFFSHFARHPEHGIQHLALVDDKAAGFSTLYFSFCSLAAAPVAYLYDLFVIEALRGRGVGGLLLEHAADIARNRGMRQLIWVTDPGNVRARQLYNHTRAHRSEWVQYTLDLV